MKVVNMETFKAGDIWRTDTFGESMGVTKSQNYQYLNGERNENIFIIIKVKREYYSRWE